MPLSFLSTSPHRFRRAKSHCYHYLRKLPLPITVIGVIVILSPLALLQFMSWRRVGRNSSDLLNDAVLRTSKVGFDKSPGGLSGALQLWMKGSGFELPILQAPNTDRQMVSCPRIQQNSNKPDFDLTNLTMTLTDLKSDGDTGIWDEEMEKRYQERQSAPRGNESSGKPLLVYIVPFSHADPGWLSTVEEYFTTSTQQALNNMLSYLTKWPDMTFIWAETSYFKMWWETLKAKERKDVRALIKSGRLELVNGGYVMPDEANCHYYAILHQYVYGHQWLYENIGVVPEHGFSIDPFGHSSSMPYLLKNLDFKTMFIQRIHYNLRKHLVQNNASEFLWQQPWDENEEASMFCHLAPNHLYTIKNICSLSPNNCYFFDFKDVFFEIDKVQIQTQAKNLLDSLRKTASVYPHNVVLYILGDDFRWNEPSEWTNQYTNYKKLIQEINGNPANNAVVKFGTLKDYYKAVFLRMENNVPDTTPAMQSFHPKVQGDFFPYADKYEDYWTGYFTSRPFFKQMSRELERDLRTAEILLVFARLALLKTAKSSDFQEDLIGLERAAIGLGLFQHHDAITGTSKRRVAMDYGEKLQNGLLMAHAVILKNIFRLAQFSSKSPVNKGNIILESYRANSYGLPIKSPLHFAENDSERRVFIFNPLVRARETVIHLFVETQNIVILDTNGKEISYQVTPALNDLNTQGLFFDIIRISFIIHLDPLALKAITIKSLGTRSQKIKISQRIPSTIFSNDLSTKIKGFTVKKLDMENSIILENAHFSASFSPENGALESITTKNDGKIHKTEIEFKRYETQSSGAYLFRPNGIGDLNPYPRTVRIIKGTLFTELQVIAARTLVHVTRIYNITSSELGNFLEFETLTELTSLPNAELILKVSTDIKSNMTIYTDSNGFQMMRRQVSHELPWAANYYPATTMGFLQDRHTRMTLHLTQAHGVGSLRSGELEVMLDRNLQQDDGRGVGEALQDLRLVKTLMRLQIENEGFCYDCPYNNPTAISTRLNLDTNYPPYVTFEQASSNITAFDYQPMRGGKESSGKVLPCDVHLLMMKPVNYDGSNTRIGLMFHRLGMDCSRNNSETDQVCVPGKEPIYLSNLFTDAPFKTYNETGFNFISSRKRLSAKTPVKVLPMMIAAVTVNLQ